MIKEHWLNSIAMIMGVLALGGLMIGDLEASIVFLIAGIAFRGIVKTSERLERNRNEEDDCNSV